MPLRSNPPLAALFLVVLDPYHGHFLALDVHILGDEMVIYTCLLFMHSIVIFLKAFKKVIIVIKVQQRVFASKLKAAISVIMSRNIHVIALVGHGIHGR